MPFSVRGGGHNIAGTALVDGGLTINMSRMRSVDYLAGINRVVVRPAAIWADVDAATRALWSDRAGRHRFHHWRGRVHPGRWVRLALPLGRVTPPIS